MRFALLALLALIGAGGCWRTVHSGPATGASAEGRAPIGADAPIEDPARTVPTPDPGDDKNENRPAVAEVREGDKSSVVSVVLPIGVTLAGVVILPVVDQMEFAARGGAKTAWNTLGWGGIAAFVIGPSLGQIYAGNPWNTGLKIRLVGAAVIGAGIAIAATEPSHAATLTTEEAIGALLILAGAIPYVGGALYEIGTGPRSVDRHNERSRHTAVIVVPVTSGSTLGLALAGSF